jgi:hypothetical protein
MEPSNAATKPPEGFSPNSGTASDNWVKLQRLGSGDWLGVIVFHDEADDPDSIGLKPRRSCLQT